MKTILLIDGSHFLFRAYHAMPKLTTTEGFPTGAIRGMISMIRSVRKQVPTEYIACVFDPKGKTFRNDIYPEYKANRPPMEEELRKQIEPTFDAIQKEGIPLLVVPGVEADDTIGTLSRMAVKEGFKVVIATGDKDYAQLVNEDVELINTMVKDESRMNIKGVVDKFGVEPDQITTFLALMGDKIDNVPGIEKCGPKKAAKLIWDYGTIENIIQNADKVKGKDGEYLRAGMAFLPMALDLVTIRTNVDLAGYVSNIEELKEKAPDREALYKLYKSLEFRSWAAQFAPEGAAEPAHAIDRRVDSGRSAASKANQVDFTRMPEYGEFIDRDLGGHFTYKTVTEKDEALKVMDEVNKTTEQVGIYVLPTNLTQQESQVLGLALCLPKGDSYYFPVRRDMFGTGFSIVEFSELFGHWLGSDALKNTSDTKFTKHVLANDGMELGGVMNDVMLQSYVLEAHRSHTIEGIAKNWIKYDLDSLDALLGKGRNKRKMTEVSAEEASKFSCERAFLIRRLGKIMREALFANPGLWYVYNEIELPLVPVLFKMEQTGVKINTQLLNELTVSLNKELEAIEEKAFKEAGEKFKLSSPKALGELLFDKMGVKVAGKAPKKTISGNYSTNEEVLSELAPTVPLASLALEYRGISKLINTYTEKLPQQVNPKDGRVHTTFEQTVAVTGRLSSTDPNLQNIPARTGEGRKIREAFVADKGCKIISADYSQIELRIMAHLSGDNGLMDAFRKGQDIHRATAAEVYGIKPEDVTPDQRRIAKVVNFGLIYGMSAFGLAKNLGISRTEARSYIEKYFHHFPGAKEFMEKTRKQASDEGHVKTVFGRELWLPEIHGAGPRRAGAERAAINAPMQGTAADLIKKGMISVQNWIEEKKLKSRLILQVHDELVLEVPDDEVELVKKHLPELMNDVSKLNVPLVTEVGVGDNWENAH